ncbi:MAG: hypothetical protein WC511_07100 [Candidatus Pacearchaeota archaeon]
MACTASMMGQLDNMWRMVQRYDMPQAKWINEQIPDQQACYPKEEPNHVPLSINPIEFVRGGDAEKYYNQLSQTKYLRDGALIPYNEMDLLRRLHQNDIKKEKESKLKRIISYFYLRK